MNLWQRYLREHDAKPTRAIIGVDPGDTTGIFICLVHTRGVIIDGYQAAAGDVYAVLRDFGVIIDELEIPNERKHVAIEKYQITRRTVKLARQPAAIEVTGVARLFASEWNALTWEFGMATSKKFASDDLLLRVGWVTKKSRRMRHARDAARQAWTCLAEVDFPTWEASWECANDVTHSEDLVYDSLMHELFKMGDDSEER